MKVFYFVCFFLTWFSAVCSGYKNVSNSEEKNKDRLIVKNNTENDCINLCKSTLQCIKYDWKNDACFLILSSDAHLSNEATTALSTSASTSSIHNETENLFSRIKRKGGRGGGGRGSSRGRGSSSRSSSRSSSSRSSYRSSSSSRHHYHGSSSSSGGGYYYSGRNGLGGGIMRDKTWSWIIFIFGMFTLLVIIWCCVVHANEYDQSKNRFRPPRQWPPPPRGTVSSTPFYNNFSTAPRHYNAPPPYPTAPFLNDEKNATTLI